MGRQRTIDDSAFWRSPKMAGRTQEDRATLSYLLTSPFSNIIGVYQIVPRIAASEMGWDTDSQLIPVLRRLSDSNFVRFDEDSSYVWIHIWWDHNSPTMAVAGTLRQRTFEQISAIPPHWRHEFVDDFVARLPVANKKVGNLRAAVQSELSAHCILPDRVSIPYPYPTHTERANTNHNNTFTVNTTTNQLRFPESLTSEQVSAVEKMLASVDFLLAQQLLDELSFRVESGSLTRGPLQYLAGLIQAAADRKFTPTANATRASRLRAELPTSHLPNASVEEEIARVRQITRGIAR
ncbi:hypothetical protein SAMN05444168_0854 [Paraburkholderia phenazinium]|uniref:Uncharacterized protein n=1 Tax=Paraburkholderia phenazinium TaxID=60549 RepID=A0A1N6EPJ4_9BURK|nr:hypothetical protein SAMN05444168_0854 [Paraburkholderia phenazinium]